MCFEQSARLSNIPAPVLIIFGTRNSLILPTAILYPNTTACRYNGTVDLKITTSITVIAMTKKGFRSTMNLKQPSLSDLSVKLSWLIL